MTDQIQPANTPEMKQEYDLCASDFVRHPVWIGVHNYDYGKPWFELADEQTFRPWLGQLPFAEARGIARVAATFELADGSVYSGHFSPQREDWDAPLPPRRMRDGTYTKPLQWSARRCGSPLSILALHRPAIFINGQIFGFHLLREPRRKAAVQAFYAAIKKSPAAVFPVRFYADPSLASGITSGRMDGFFSFPLDKPVEIDTGAALLNDEGESIK
jgi:hypothetical protein